MSEELKNNLKELSLYDDGKDKILPLDPSLLVRGVYFDNNHKDRTINDKLVNLKDEIKKKNIIELRKKIYDGLNKLIETYSNDVETTFLLDSKKLDLNFLTCSVTDIYRCTKEEIDIFNLEKITTNVFYKPKKLADFVDTITFNDISNILKNFKDVVNRNGHILSQYSSYFDSQMNKINNLKFNLSENFSKSSCGEFISKLESLLKEGVGPYFENYKRFKNYGEIYLKKHHKLLDFEKKISEVVGSLVNIDISFSYDLHFLVSGSDVFYKLNQLFINEDLYKLYIYQLYLMKGSTKDNINKFKFNKEEDYLELLINTLYKKENSEHSFRKVGYGVFFFLDKGRMYHYGKIVVKELKRGTFWYTDKEKQIFTTDNGLFENLLKKFPLIIIETIGGKDCINLKNFHDILMSSINKLKEFGILKEEILFSK